jgi:hypothetical protein
MPHPGRVLNTTGNMAEPLIREATPADAAGIAEVHIAGWRWGYRGLLPDALLESLSVERREVGWRDALARPADEQTTFVAEVAGRIVGFAGAAPVTTRTRRRARASSASTCIRMPLHEVRYAIALPTGGKVIDRPLHGCGGDVCIQMECVAGVPPIPQREQPLELVVSVIGCHPLPVGCSG